MTETATAEYEGEFILERFNPVRAMRGVGAAEVTIRSEDLETTLWMTRHDIENNIRQFGPHPGLIEAREAYIRNLRFERKLGF